METAYEQWQQQFKMKMLHAPLQELEQELQQMAQQLKEQQQFADLSSLYYTEVNMYFNHSSAYKALQKLVEYRPYFEQYASHLEALRIRLGTYSILEVAGYDETFFEGIYALLKEIRRIDSPLLEVMALNNLGIYLLKNERFEESIGYFLEAARVYEQHPDVFFGSVAYYLALNLISNSAALNNREQAEKWHAFAIEQGAHDPFIAIFLKVIDMTWELDYGDEARALQLAHELLDVDVTQYDNRIFMMLNNMRNVFRHHEAVDEEIEVLEKLIMLTKDANSEQMKRDLVACHYDEQQTSAKESVYEDALTHIWTRQGFEKTVAPLLSSNNKQCKMLAIIDVDYFKSINDTYGHSVGDAALQEICRRVERVMSTYMQHTPSLYFGRYGGDEFVLYYEATEQQQKTFIEQLHHAVTHEPFKQRQTTFPLSVSIGAVTATQQASYEQLLQLADAALYDMKRTEKGRFVIVPYV